MDGEDKDRAATPDLTEVGLASRHRWLGAGLPHASNGQWPNQPVAKPFTNMTVDDRKAVFVRPGRGRLDLLVPTST
jgi:hypothetical protein